MESERYNSQYQEDIINMKKIISAAVVALMLAPTGVQAKTQSINIVTGIKSKYGTETFTYNKDGFVKKIKDGAKFKYKNGKIVSMNDDGTETFTYRNNALAKVNGKKVTKSHGTMKILNENMKEETSPKGTLYTYKLKKAVGWATKSSFLLNKKGQLIYGYDKTCNYKFTYDQKGYTTFSLSVYDDTGAGPTVYKYKNTYKNGLLTYRKAKVNEESTDSTDYEKLTYKKMRVRNAKAVMKQQKALINHYPDIALIFAQ